MKLHTFTLTCSLLVSSVAFGKSQQIDRIAAVVNNDIIMMSELQQAEQRYQQQKTLLPPAATYRRRVLERLILDKIKHNFLSNNNAEVTSASVDNAIAQIAQNNNLSIDQLISQLPSQGITLQELRDKISGDIERAQLRQLLIPSKVVLNKIALKKEIAKLPKSIVLGSGPKYYHVGHILIQGDSNRATANAVIRQLRQGKKFSSLAQKYSAAPTAETGGDLGWRKRNEFPDLIASMLKGKGKGTVKGPKLAAGGWHIIKILETAGGTIRRAFSQAELTEKASQTLTNIKVNKYLDRLLHKLKQNTYIDIRL